MYPSGTSPQMPISVGAAWLWDDCTITSSRPISTPPDSLASRAASSRALVTPRSEPWLAANQPITSAVTNAIARSPLEM